jgi:transmembrane sensor
MSEPGKSMPDDDPLFAEAARWFARMRGPDAEDSRAGFDDWLARGAGHRAAYNRASEVFALGKLLEEEDRAGHSRALRSHIRPFVPAGVAALLLAGTLSFLAFDPRGGRNENPGSRAQAARLESPPGEVRQVRLADGSLVTLEPGTLVDARFDAQGRHLTLGRGTALFRVAHQRRPFVVFAGGGTVTARGTLFAVGLSLDRKVSVRLIEGVVDVTIPEQSGGRPGVRRLRGGERVSFRTEAPRKAEGSVPRARRLPEAAPGSQVQDFTNVRLADLAALASRNGPRPIRLADTDLGEQRVSGRFALDDPDRLADRVARLFGLVVDRSDPAALVLRRR